MKTKHFKHILLVCASLLGISLAGVASAADVNKLVAVCANCHGKAGASTESEVPIIGGYSVDFLVNNLKAYKNQDRACPETEFRSGSKKGQKTNMCNMVKDMGDSEMKLVAQYFSKQKFVKAKQKFDPELARKGKEIHDMSCEKCHSEGGSVAKDDAGMMAGQWMPYLRQALDEFSTGKRPIAKKMKLKLDDLNKEDFEALVNYYGSIK
ncbi:MAG: c-type cytochrome [Sideroxydans sp.]|nr:c-type cytochrome [Sideroxydans sp.]